MSTITLTDDGGRPRVLRWTAAEAHRGPIHLRDLDAGAGYAACLAVLSGRAPRIHQRDAAKLFARLNAGSSRSQAGLTRVVTGLPKITSTRVPRFGR